MSKLQNVVSKFTNKPYQKKKKVVKLLNFIRDSKIKLLKNLVVFVKLTPFSFEASSLTSSWALFTKQSLGEFTGIFPDL